LKHFYIAAHQMIFLEFPSHGPIGGSLSIPGAVIFHLSKPTVTIKVEMKVLSSEESQKLVRN